MRRTGERTRFHLSCVVASSLVICLGIASAAEATTIPARRLLPKLTVRSEQNGGYDRARFADWLDRDGDGCDTRAEVLIAENRGDLRKDRYCTVISGRWLSVFDGRVWRRASAVDIDHLVALAEAWGSGARKWSARQRARFANDLGYRWSLNAMTDDLNVRKSARDPSEWLPRKKRCRYAATAVGRLRLSVRPAPGTSDGRVIPHERGCLGMLSLLPRRSSLRPINLLRTKSHVCSSSK